MHVAGPDQPRASGQSSARSPLAAAAGSGSSAIDLDAVTRTEAGCGAEGGSEVGRPPALRTQPRDQEDRARHQLAKARQMAGLGCADHRPQAGQPALAHQAVGALGHQAGQALEQGRLGSRQVEQIGRPGIGGAHQDEQTRACLRGSLEQGFEGVGAHQGVDGGRVRPQTGDVAPGRRRRAEQRLRVGRGADRHVSALAVRDHHEPGLPRRVHGPLERRPTGRAEPLEARQLGLGGDAGRTRPLDQRAAVGGDRLAGSLGGTTLRRRGTRVEPRRIGVQPEAELALALLDERGEAVGEGRRAHPVPAFAPLADRRRALPISPSPGT